MTITVVAGNNRRLLVPVMTSHSNWVNSYNAGSPSAKSNLGGTFSQVASPVMIGNSSGNRQGSVTVLEMLDPAVGTHTITVNIAASQAITFMAASSICFNNVIGRGTPVTQAMTGTVTPLSIAVVTGKNTDMAFIATVADNPGLTLNGAWPSSPGLWLSQIQNVNGQGDCQFSAYVQGDGTTKTFTSASTTLYHGSIGFNLVGG